MEDEEFLVPQADGYQSPGIEAREERVKNTFAGHSPPFRVCWYFYLVQVLSEDSFVFFELFKTTDKDTESRRMSLVLFLRINK